MSVDSSVTYVSSEFGLCLWAYFRQFHLRLVAHSVVRRNLLHCEVMMFVNY